MWKDRQWTRKQACITRRLKCINSKWDAPCTSDHLLTTINSWNFWWTYKQTQKSNQDIINLKHTSTSAKNRHACVRFQDMRESKEKECIRRLTRYCVLWVLLHFYSLLTNTAIGKEQTLNHWKGRHEHKFIVQWNKVRSIRYWSEDFNWVQQAISYIFSRQNIKRKNNP